MNTSLHAIRAVSVLVLVTASGIAQSRVPMQRQPHPGVSPATSGNFGHHARGLGDLDGDGFDDFGVGAENFAVTGGGGRVLLYSGRTGALLSTLDGSSATIGFGRAFVSVGDVNGDGFGDVAVGAPDADPAGLANAGQVRLFDGDSGAVLWTLDGIQIGQNFGYAIGAVNDTDADGVRELVVTSPGKITAAGVGGGRVDFVRGDTGVAFGWSDGTLGFQGFGTSLATRPETGLVYVGTGLGAIWSVPLPVAGGVPPVLFLAAPAGVNDDASLSIVNSGTAGAPDWALLIGWWTADSGGFANNGRVELRGTPIGAADFAFTGGFTGEGVGRVVSQVFDVDGDGREDLAFSSLVAGAPGLLRYRVVDDAGTLEDEVTRVNGSLVLSSLRDVTGDGRGEWLTTINSGVSLEFEATVFSKGLSTLSAGKDAAGDYRASFQIDLASGIGGDGYLMVLSASGAAPGIAGVPPGTQLIPLNPDFFTTTFLQLVGTVVLPDAVGILNGAGKKTTNLYLPKSVLPQLVGVEFTVAGIAFDLGTSSVTAVSNPVEIAMP